MKTCTLCCFAAFVAASALYMQPGLGQDFAPFPANRVRDFYSRQAEEQLDSPVAAPELLAQFPGLDGGAFGHWGQNPAERSIDRTLNDVDSGPVICSRIIHFGNNTQKGVAVSLSSGPGAVSAVFDPQRLTCVDSWQGGFVIRGSNRFGVHDGARANGDRLFDFTASHWNLAPETNTRYLGYYRHGNDVVFSYQLGNARVLDRVWVHGDTFMRSLQFEGDLPKNTQLRLLKSTQPLKTANHDGYIQVTGATSDVPLAVALRDNTSATLKTHEQDGQHLITVNFSGTPQTPIHLQFSSTSANLDNHLNSTAAKTLPDPADLTHGGPGLWNNHLTTTSGRKGAGVGAFAIDTLTIPFGTANAFGTPMRLAGVGTLSEDQMAVSTLLGDVWVVSGVDQDLQELKWQRTAAGLYQPLGLVVKDGKIILGGNDQVTRLHDLNGDGEADFYECVTNEYPTTGGHDFATSLQQDNSGQLYWATASGDFGLTRLTEGQKPTSLGNGLRNCNGIGVSADGSMTLATVQEGSWTPATAIFNVRNNSFHGHNGPRDGHGAFGYDLPLCFIPRGIDNSAGEICFLPQDDRLGPLSGMTIGSSYGYCNHYMILKEDINGVVQGGVVPLPGEFLSGACRLNFNPHDGCVYVAGTEGWQSYAAEPGCLQRLRFTGRPMHLVTQVESRSNGLIVHCNTQLDPDSIHKENVFCQQWNYLYSGAYGSPEYSVKEEGRQGHDHVPVRSVHLLPDGRSVFVEIPQLHPVMQFHLHMRLKSASGDSFTPDAYLSIYEQKPSFTDFPDYQLITKRRWPDFPKAEKYEQDPRLVEQDAYGTNFGWVSSATRLTLNAVTGLQYEPRRLRVSPGARVALTFHNNDPSMPHNVVVVKADQMESFGEQAMVLASNPRAIATHYVPDDPAEICFSPILNPSDQYTVYFEAPKEEGRYRFICTYPGHWKVMRGTLHILPDDKPLPAPTEDEIVRQFVKRWTLKDFADEAESLQGRSSIRGKQVFTQAGCIKCHRIGNEGTKLGPDLSDVAKRFQGSKLLQQILEPSAEINKQFQTWIAVTTEGQTLAGLMTDQTDTSITLLPNPLRPETVTTLSKDDIDELVAARQSTMPEGLLMTFSKEEIMDLLAFIQSEHAPQP